MGRALLPTAEPCPKDVTKDNPNSRFRAEIAHGLRRDRMLHVFAKNSGWLVAGKLLRLCLGILVTALMARYLRPTAFGLLSFATAFVTLFSALSNLGHQGLIVRELVTSPERRELLLGSGLLLRLIGCTTAVALVAITVAFARAGAPHVITIVVVVALMLPPQAWDIIDFDFQARLQTRAIVLIRSLSFFLASAGRLLLVFLGATLLGFACMVPAETILCALLMIIYGRKRGSTPKLRYAERAELLHLLKTGWPLVISGLSIMIYWRIDQVMLGELSGDAAVGLFSAAVRISEAWYFLPLSVMSAAAPILTSIFHRSRHEYLLRLEQITRFMFLTGVSAALFLTIFARHIVLFLYGPRYLPSSTILAIHCWAGIFVAFGTVSSSWFINTGRLRFSMYKTIVGVLCNVSLNLLLIPKYAGVGAAIATIVSQILVAFIFNAATPATRELFFTQLLAFVPRRIQT